MDTAINFFVDDGDFESKRIIVTWLGLTGKGWMHLCIGFVTAMMLYFHVTDA
jgi:hypothetical protein